MWPAAAAAAELAAQEVAMPGSMEALRPESSKEACRLPYGGHGKAAPGRLPGGETASDAPGKGAMGYMSGAMPTYAGGNGGMPRGDRATASTLERRILSSCASASSACRRFASSIRSPPIRRISRPHSLTLSSSAATAVIPPPESAVSRSTQSVTSATSALRSVRSADTSSSSAFRSPRS
eukprot:scaffold188799_cov31-Tisochrysis_lutea.AAC.2